jgi:hypothetical protein
MWRGKVVAMVGRERVWWREKRRRERAEKGKG